MQSKDTDGLANSVDPDQNAPELGLHCLLRSICPNKKCIKIFFGKILF